VTRHSPVTTYSSPLEMRRARQKPGMSGGALLAAVVMVAAYALAGWLAVRKRDAAPEIHGADGGRSPSIVRAGAIRNDTIVVSAPAPTHVGTDGCHRVAISIGRSYIGGQWMPTPGQPGPHDDSIQVCGGPAWREHGAPPCNGCEP